MNEKKIPQPTPDQEEVYFFHTLPEELHLSFLLRKARYSSQIAVESVGCTFKNRKMDDRALRCLYMSGVSEGRSIVDALPLLKLHPVLRMLLLVKEERAHFSTQPGLNHFDSEAELKASLEKLTRIEDLILLSQLLYPGELNTDPVQVAFQLAASPETLQGNIEPGTYIGRAALDYSGRHWEDVQCMTDEQAQELKTLQEEKPNEYLGRIYIPHIWEE
jgi:hypothetical protein